MSSQFVDVDKDGIKTTKEEGCTRCYLNGQRERRGLYTITMIEKG
jgi:hypothetical protein